MTKEIEWFKLDGTGVMTNVEDEGLVLYGDVVPDVVLVPKESPIYAGERLKVLSHDRRQCPRCGERVVRVLELEQQLFVAECQPEGCGYVFYQQRMDS